LSETTFDGLEDIEALKAGMPEVIALRLLEKRKKSAFSVKRART